MTKAERRSKGIYWDRSLNCFTGCSPAGNACLNCWARRMAYRLRGRFGYPDDEPFRSTFHPEQLKQVNSKQKPQVIALCFMSDPFHANHRIFDIFQMLEKIVECSQHIFIALTKRPTGMQWYLSQGDLIPNLVGGVSVWDQKSADRMIPILLETNLATRIVSLEPLLEAVNIEPYLIPEGHCLGCGKEAMNIYQGQHWVGPDHDPNSWEPCGPVSKGGIDGIILGGETGPGARPMHPDWVKSVRDQCQAAEVPFFFKMWGEWLPADEEPSGDFSVRDPEKFHFWGDEKKTPLMKVGRKAAGRLLDGRTWDDLPEVMK